MNFSQIFTTFGAGFLASLTPCVYPMIPITLGYFGSQKNMVSSGQSKARIGSYLLGQVLTLTALGVLAVSLGEAFGFSTESRWINLGVGALFLVMGFLSYFSKLPRFLTILSDRLQHKLQPDRSDLLTGLMGALILGAASALIASPCSTPVLGGVLSLIATQGSFFQGVILMLSYSFGFCLLFALLGFGLMSFRKIPRSGQWLVWVHQLSSLALLVCGGYYIATGLRVF